MKQQLLVIFLCKTAITAFAQTTIFGEITLHQDAKLTFFDSPVRFVQGNISAPEANDAIVVFSAAQAQSANDNSHVETPIFIRHQTDFTFPTGDQGIYQPLSIINGDDSDLAVFFQRISFEDISLPKGVNFISNQFHWLVSGEKRAQLWLSWNTNSLLNQMTDALDELVILGYTNTGWEVIASQLGLFAADGITPTSLEEGTLLSEDNIPFSRYKAFTIGGAKKITSIMVSEGLTPNGDNVNDTWYIENIERHPDVVIRVYNRWGGEVFFHQGIYNNDWGGTYKNNLETLPDAPYYYRIDLDNDGYVEHQGWIYINH